MDIPEAGIWILFPEFLTCSTSEIPKSLPDPWPDIPWMFLSPLWDIPSHFQHPQELPNPSGPRLRHSRDIPLPAIPQRDHPCGSRGNRGFPGCTKPPEIHGIPNPRFPAPEQPQRRENLDSSRSQAIPDLRLSHSQIPEPPQLRLHDIHPHPGAHPCFPTCPECWEGNRHGRSQLLLPFPRLFPAFPEAGKRLSPSRRIPATPGGIRIPDPGSRWDPDPAGAGITPRRRSPGRKSGKQENSGIPSPARGGSHPQSFGIGREFGRGSQGILPAPLPAQGDPPRIPGKAGAAPAARKEPGQEGGRSGRRSRGAATPPGSGGTFPDPGMPGILGILPRGAPIPILIPIPEWFRERWECQEGKPGRGWEPWGAPHPTVWGWLQSRDALGIPSGNGEPAG